MQLRPMTEAYFYQLPKIGHPRSWNAKAQRSPRDYWFHLTKLADHDDDREILVKRKQLTWTGACNFGSAWFSSVEDADILFCIDGRVPKEHLDFPPHEAVWNRWQRSPFDEDGAPCLPVFIGFDHSITEGWHSQPLP